MKFKKFLSGKIHQARVTRLDPEYEGSLSICPQLMKLAGIEPGEEILVADIETGVRFVTYAIEGDLHMIGVNGAAANMNIRHLDRLIIMTFQYVENSPDIDEANIVFCSSTNTPVEKE